MPLVAQAIVAVAGVYLLLLAGAAVMKPRATRRYLEAHASTARLHALELGIRLVVGAAFIAAAPQMRGAGTARLAGWGLVVTTMVLALVPWRLHRRFARWAVPQATRHMWLVAAGATGGGIAVLAGLLSAPRG